MAEQFKPGDWVEVVDPLPGARGDYVLGEIVQVEDVQEEDVYTKLGHYLRISGKKSGMYSSRFKKASPPLPDVFQFRSSGYATPLYTATKISDGYKISWVVEGRNTSMNYNVETVTRLTGNGTWKILPPANGIDGQNNPLNFTKDMLKPMMRVTTMNDLEWIVVDNVQEGFEEDTIGVSLSGFNRLYDSTQRDTVGNGYVIKEVYECTHLNNYILTPSKKGPLIWKRAEQPKAVEPEPSPLQKRLDYLQVHIDAVKENVESLEKEMKELQEEAGNV